MRSPALAGLFTPRLKVHLRRWLKLLRSMRFAVAILAVVAVAASIGSVLEQSQPQALYISRYGQFRAAFYALCGLTDVYHAAWFFALLAFMATSTALCLWQNTPAMLRDMRSYREQKSLASLRRLEHSAELALPRGTGADAALRQRLSAYLAAHGLRYKYVPGAGGYLLAARSGALRRAGYLLVHAAMVLICLGGLIDGNVALRLRLWSGALKVETRDLAPRDVPAASQLDAGAASFRAAMSLAEGHSASTALLQLNDGYLLQRLPFSVRLKQFRMAHYANGQPKDFASDIEIIDGARTLAVTLRVNHPYTYRGVTLFQSGFSDGGSQVALRLLPVGGDAAPQPVAAQVGASSALLIGGRPYTLEVNDLRPMNVYADAETETGRSASWTASRAPGQHMRDAGPSLDFALRDQSGQADAWQAYLKPARIDGASYFLLGHRGPRDQRETPMRYLRLPADAAGGLDGYGRLAAALAQPARRAEAARALAAGAGDPQLAAALESTTRRLLDGFAASGYRAVAALVPPGGSAEQQAKAGKLYLNLLERAAANFDAGAPPRLVHDSLAAYGDALDAGLPALFQFSGYSQVNASGLQLTRAPGAKLVYLGAALLALGVCAMYFVRERRLWLRVDADALLLAFAANRHSPALRAEFEAHRAAILDVIAEKR